MQTEFYEKQLQSLRQSGNLRQLHIRERSGYQITQNGKSYIDFSSNDYLGLATQTSFQKDFKSLLDTATQLWSSSSSRLLNGNPEIATQLEKTLAEDYEKEAALLFNSGYHANIGILTALATSKDLILADKLVHASLIDGMRLSAAKWIRYKHNDWEHLEQLLAKYRGEYHNVFLATESIFSMDGDQACLPKLVELKKRYHLTLYLDEAHSVGVLGKKGLGLAEENNCMADFDIIVGTFGKALASVGAFAVCSQTVKQWLINTMRPLIFSTALPPVNLLWTQYIWNYCKKATTERKQLVDLQTLLSTHLQKNVLSHIFPIPCKDAQDCLALSEHLRREGFLCLPVRTPTVPKGSERIRVSLQAGIPPKEIIRFAKTVCQCQ